MLFIMFYLKFYKFVFPDFLVSYRNMVALCLFFHFNWFVACFTCTSMNLSFANCLLDFLTNSPYWTDVYISYTVFVWDFLLPEHVLLCFILPLYLDCYCIQIFPAMEYHFEVYADVLNFCSNLFFSIFIFQLMDAF